MGAQRLLRFGSPNRLCLQPEPRRLGFDQYLLASKKLPQARHLHCIVITWLPKSEITTVSADLQNGHAGPSAHASGALMPSERLRRSAWGLSTGRHVSLFREALQHVERRLIDAARLGSPADRLPTSPLDGGLRCAGVEAFFQQPSQVAHAVGQLAAAMQLIDVTVFRSDPFHRFPPRAPDRRTRLHLAHPAPAMERVIALFLEHLLEPAAQRFHA